MTKDLVLGRMDLCPALDSFVAGTCQPVLKEADAIKTVVSYKSPAMANPSVLTSHHERPDAQAAVEFIPIISSRVLIAAPINRPITVRRKKVTIIWSRGESLSKISDDKSVGLRT